ncbi:RecQ family ATP-dependent DNA helicase [bacterium]|nr:RecQ family ATP-dependent DNA helicase [bacterium]
MGVSSQRPVLLDLLRRHWGYDGFRPLQQEAMEAHLSRRDSIVILPTGGGKSLCFQAPALAMEGTAIVVSPLISLMKDQVDTLRGMGIQAGKLHSGQPVDEARAVGDALRSGDLRLLYVSPERLIMEGFDRITRGAPVSFLAVDEAHCISEWGHDFRKEYRMLAGFREAFPEASIHAYTATATPQVAKDMGAQLGLRKPVTLIGSFDRPNLFYRSEPRGDATLQIRRIAARHRGESGIVYCISRKDTEKIAEELRGAGIDALPYHAGLADEVRATNQDRFINDEVQVIVATIAFGMGIDKPDVRFVVHAGLPKSLENYQQESGRAGRDGLASECVLLHSGADIMKWKHITRDLPAAQLRISNNKLRAVEDYATSFACRRAALLRYFGEGWTQESCGGCDVCAGHPSPVPDSLVVAQKILSCVKRLREEHGPVYTANVLRAADDARIVEAGHHQLSTYGLLRDVTAEVVRGWIAQLSAQGYLLLDGRGEAPLRVTARGWEAIHGRATPQLFQPSARGEEFVEEEVPQNDEWQGVDRDLFEELRILRANLAKDSDLRPYQVFGDRTLREMASVRPSTLAGLGRLYGVGQRKRESYGDAFLAAIRSFCKRRPELPVDVDLEAAPPPRKASGPSPDRVKAQALELLRKGGSVRDVAEVVHRAESTIRGYLVSMIGEENLTDPELWVPASDVKRIRSAAKKLDEYTRLRPIFDHLEGSIPYDHISITLACLRNSRGE